MIKFYKKFEKRSQKFRTKRPSKDKYIWDLEGGSNNWLRKYWANLGKFRANFCKYFRKIYKNLNKLYLNGQYVYGHFSVYRNFMNSLLTITRSFWNRYNFRPVSACQMSNIRGSMINTWSEKFGNLGRHYKDKIVVMWIYEKELKNVSYQVTTCKIWKSETVP